MSPPNHIGLFLYFMFNFVSSLLILPCSSRERLWGLYVAAIITGCLYVWTFIARNSHVSDFTISSTIRSFSLLLSHRRSHHPCFFCNISTMDVGIRNQICVVSDGFRIPARYQFCCLIELVQSPPFLPRMLWKFTIIKRNWSAFFFGDRFVSGVDMFWLYFVFKLLLFCTSYTLIGELINADFAAFHVPFGFPGSTVDPGPWKHSFLMSRQICFFHEVFGLSFYFID